MTASADRIVDAAVALLLLAHIGAFVWAGLLRKGMASILALNLLVSTGVVIYWAPRIVELLTDLDVTLVFVGFELFVFGTSLLAIRGVRMPAALVWMEFAAHALLVMAALAFMVTFKIDRLI